MSSDDRLYRLGLLHLRDKPKELSAALDKILLKYEERRKKLNQAGEVIGRHAKSGKPAVAPVQKATEAVPTSSRRSARFSDLLSSPATRKPSLGTDTAWALKLKAAVDSAARELAVEVRRAKPICVPEATNPNDMIFELDTSKGKVQATSHRNGKISFRWVG